MKVWMQRSAALGALVWLGFALVSPGHEQDRFYVLVHLLILVGPLITVPLGLSSVRPVEDGRALLLRVLTVAQFPAALLLVGSMLLERGVSAAVMAVPWLCVTGLVALLGVMRSGRAGLAQIEERSVDAGLVYLVVGGVWMVASRAGVLLMGFDLVIVTLTAAHFHFAGFAAPVITGLVGRCLPREGGAWRAYQVAATSVIVSPILVAVGITVSPLVEVICAITLALGLLVLSGLMVFFVAPKLRNLVAWILLTLSGLSLVGTMALAVTYAVGEYLHETLILIPGMAQSHGAMNVFGFALCGLLAMAIHDPSPR